MGSWAEKKKVKCKRKREKPEKGNEEEMRERTKKDGSNVFL